MVHGDQIWAPFLNITYTQAFFQEYFKFLTWVSQHPHETIETIVSGYGVLVAGYFFVVTPSPVYRGNSFTQLLDRG
jgi:hypothetical protein